MFEVINILFILFMSGLIFGSFFNVVGLRLPKGESIIYPNSHCPHCQHFLSWKDNLPVISYLLLKGRCRFCDVKISQLYPMIEFGTGLLFMYAAYQMNEYNLFISLVLISLVILVLITDIYYFIIPNKLLAFFMSLFIIIRVIHPLTPWYDSLLGFLISYLLIFLLIVISRGGMGAGDMKYLAVLGFLTGTKAVLLGFIFAILLGGMYGIYLLIVKRKGKSESVPFGPFIGFGILVSYYHSNEIIGLYITAILK